MNITEGALGPSVAQSANALKFTLTACPYRDRLGLDQANHEQSVTHSERTSVQPAESVRPGKAGAVGSSRA